MCRHGTPEDVAALVGYLASDAAAFVTGQCIVVDGGLTITSPMTRIGEPSKVRRFGAPFV